jgi:hypothetical protein
MPAAERQYFETSEWDGFMRRRAVESRELLLITASR